MKINIYFKPEMKVDLNEVFEEKKFITLIKIRGGNYNFSGI